MVQVALQAFSSLLQLITCFDHEPEATLKLKRKFRRISEEFYNFVYPANRLVIINN